MVLAQRIGDGEDRVVHGGELPEEDGSLDDVVVDAPYVSESGMEINPGELWSSYVIRRLEAEGIKVADFENSKFYFESKTELNNGVYLRIMRGVEPHAVDNMARFGALGKEVSKKDFVMNLLTFDSVDIIYDFEDSSEDEMINFIFEAHSDSEKENSQVDIDYQGAPPPFECEPDWFNSRYTKGPWDLRTMKVVDDIVKYVKELGLKQDDNS